MTFRNFSDEDLKTGIAYLKEMPERHPALGVGGKLILALAFELADRESARRVPVEGRELFPEVSPVPPTATEIINRVCDARRTPPSL